MTTERSAQHQIARAIHRAMTGYPLVLPDDTPDNIRTLAVELTSKGLSPFEGTPPNDATWFRLPMLYQGNAAGVLMSKRATYIFEASIPPYVDYQVYGLFLTVEGKANGIVEYLRKDGDINLLDEVSPFSSGETMFDSFRKNPTLKAPASIQMGIRITDLEGPGRLTAALIGRRDFS